MSRPLLVVFAALALAGCLPRLSDPVYALRPLRAPEPRREGQTLLFGTIEFEPGFFGHRIAEVVVKRIRPAEPDVERIVATTYNLYRAFRPRQIKGAHFVGVLDPGAYELVRIVGGGLISTPIDLDEDAKRASRFTVTRPGIADVGVLYVKSVGVDRYSIAVLAPESRPGRAEILRAAVEGTQWERFLPADGAR